MPATIRRLSDRHLASDSTSCWWSSRRAARTPISTTASSTPTAAKSAMRQWRALLRALCARQRSVRKVRDPGRDPLGLIEPRLETDGRVTVTWACPISSPRRFRLLPNGEHSTYALEVDGRIDRDRRLIDGQSARGADRRRRRCGAGGERGPADRAPSALSASGSMPDICRSSTGITLNCGCSSAGPGNAVLRHRRLCGGCGGNRARTARFPGGSADTRGGMLEIAWSEKAQPVSMTGPAQSVFEGEIDL